METNVPNLDAMWPDTLMAFWFRHSRGRKARELFPEGGEGTRKAAKDLANYASNKAAAMGCRSRGDIPTAIQYENIADRIYNGLPAFARW